MEYLYADSTRVPVLDNVLAMVCEATNTSVALLQAAEGATQVRREIEAASRRAEMTLAQLEILSRQLTELCRPASSDDSEETVEMVKSSIGQSAHAALIDAWGRIMRKRDGACATAMRPDPLSRVLPTLSSFLSRHQLPDTTWSLCWAFAPGSQAPTVQAVGQAPCGIDALFEVALPQGHLWSAPVRVRQLLPRVSVHLPSQGWLRKSTSTEVRLDKMFVTAVAHMPDRAGFRCSRSASNPSQGIEITLRDATSDRVLARRFGADGQALGTPEPLGPEDSANVARLWARIEETIFDVPAHRARATRVSLHGARVEEIPEPEAIASAMIQSVAPFVREIVRRSSGKGELAIKRVLGEGRREELFVRKDTLLAAISVLPERHRGLFAPFELDAPRSVGATVHLLPAPALPRLRAVND